jgi:hypothetical protein
LFELFEKSSYSVCYGDDEGYIVIDENDIFFEHKAETIQVPFDDSNKPSNYSINFLSFGFSPKKNIFGESFEKSYFSIDPTHGKALLDSTVYLTKMD